jgi:8-oxo-dGTP diphosphatase
VLLVDAANVVGSRPNGWWRDRAGAARQLVERIRAAAAGGRLGGPSADLATGPIVVVLEGAARPGVAEGTAEGVEVVHAPGSGDDTLVALAKSAPPPVQVVSADRGLRARIEAAGGQVAGPGWLLDRLDTRSPHRDRPGR